MSGLVDWWRDLDADKVLSIKTGVACVAGALLAVGAVLAWRRREHVLRRTRDVLLATIGVASVCCYFNLFHFHYDDPLHEWDIYHYYVGGKYLPELGYARLYTCTVVAENELDDGVDPRRTITDLTTNNLVPVTEALADPAACTSHFSTERWHAFTLDIAYFRSTFNPQRWTNEVLHDHGFNGTPVWALLGRPLASITSASHGQVVALSSIDPLLLLAMWIAFAWAFGWRASCVGMVWWGTSFPTLYFWNGGAFLRMDWLVLAVVGICLVKRDRPFAGGVALAYSTLLRVFPGFIIAALLLAHVIAWVRARRVTITPALRRFAFGCAVATAILVPASLVVGGGAHVASDFVANSRKHLDTPLTNNMGLKTIVSYDPSTRVRVAYDPTRLDGFEHWKALRRSVFESRRWLYAAAIVAFLVLFGWVTIGAPDWIVLVLGAGLIPFASELTCYYYGFLLVFAALFPERPIIGVGLCITAAASCIITKLAPFSDSQFYDISAYVLTFVSLTSAIYRLQGLAQVRRLALS